MADLDLVRTVASLSELTEHVQKLVDVAEEATRILADTVRRVDTLEERFREHGHIGETATVGLGSCWDGS